MASPLRPRNLLLGTLAVIALAALVLLTSDDARRSAELRGAELLGDVAAGVVASNMPAGEGNEGHSRDFISIPIEVRQLAPQVWQARGVGNTQLVATSEGNVVFDTGLVLQAAKQRRLLGESVPGPTTHVILSHSHADHSGGTRFWLEDGVEVVAHREFAEEQRYLKELEPYLHDRNRMLFPFMPEEPPSSGMFVYGGIEPTVLVDEGQPLVFTQGGVRFEVIATPGAEGADNICLWLPEQKILFVGDFFGPNFPQFPNVFTMRGEKVRKPVEYIQSLEKVIALEPEMIVPSHQDPIRGREEIRANLVKMRDAVRYVHDATVAGMNAGKTVHQLMEEVVLPPELEVTQIHGRVSWAVKSIWEYYATWFHFDTTTELYPVPRSEVFADLATLGSVDALAARAEEYTAAGQPVHALHLLDVAIGAEPHHRGALEARRHALEQLRSKAQAGLHNTYEMDWLSYRLTLTEQALAEAS